MRDFFVHPWVLLLLPVALVVLALMILGDIARRRASARLGEAKLIDALVSFDAGPRRALKGALRVLAVVFAIVAAARPRYGRGTRAVPAADVNAMVVFDVSKSMYAEDIQPSRLEKARLDVAAMIRSLPSIQWGAVCFAGDSAALAPGLEWQQTINFINTHEPWEMPGGTAIAKALERARRELIPTPGDPTGGSAVDPRSPNRRRKNVIVLVTDGEDLEGDPIEVARTAYEQGITIDVVLVGHRAPQPIPLYDDDTGQKQGGFIVDDDGQQILTELTSRAEEQLRAIATETKGTFVHVAEGEDATGITEIERSLKSMIAKEGTGHVDTLYAEQYAVPLAIALGLLLIDVAIGEARRRKKVAEAAIPEPTRRRAFPLVSAPLAARRLAPPKSKTAVDDKPNERLSKRGARDARP